MSEVLFEGGPTLIGKGSVFGSSQICLHLLFQRTFILRKPFTQIGIGIALPQLSRHFFDYTLDFWIVLLSLNQIVEI